jgi:hypothetical protein
MIAITLSPEIVAGQQPTAPKLTLSQVEELVSHHVPDSTMSTQILRRGLAFTPNMATIESLRAKGAGPLTLAAVQTLLPGATQSAMTKPTDGGPTLALTVRNIQNERSVVGSMRVLILSEALYTRTYPAKGFAASLDSLGPAIGTGDEKHAGFIDETLATGRRAGYQFTVSIPAGNSTGGTNFNYFIVAKPLSGDTGRHSFCADSSGTIHYAAQVEGCTVTSPTIPTPAECIEPASFAACVAGQVGIADEWLRSQH